MFERIPEELKTYRQFVVWKYKIVEGQKPEKILHCAHTGKYASTADPSTWANYEDALKAAPWFSGIGFVITRDDPFTCIDLDDPYEKLTDGSYKYKNPEKVAERQKKIFKAFESYSEISPSGKGLHIWIKGSVESGHKREGVELYPHGRYMTLTGNVHRDGPIQEQQALLTQLWEEMGGSNGNIPIVHNDEQERKTDEEIIEEANKARNGELFKELFMGRWQGRYPSQSEADYALVDILSFYSSNNSQVARIFRSSELGKRKKAGRDDYLNNMILKSRDRRYPPIDMEGLNRQMNEAMARKMQNISVEATCAMPEPIAEHNPYSVPPGLLGEIAQFIYKAAPRPVPEIALVGAIGLMSGICGRAFNVSGTGLNQYLLLLAQTGTGKEAMASGISKLMGAVQKAVPSANDYIGPGEFASSRALIKNLDQSLTKSFVSTWGEFGIMLSQMAGKYADSNLKGLRRLLLDIYHKSGEWDFIRPVVYSDKANNVPEIPSPALTLLCESTPEEFYKVLDDSLISQGFIPRFTIVEYRGKRPPLNENHVWTMPEKSLVDALGSLCAQTLLLNSQRKVVKVQFLPDATKLCNDFDKHCDYQINETSKDAIKHIWNRGHIKVLKLSALIAIGLNSINPVIDPCVTQWAIDLVKADAHNLIARSEDGSMAQVDEPMEKMLRRIRKMIKKFVYSSNAAIKDKRMQIYHSEKIVPYTYLLRQFSGNVRGPELSAGLKALVASGELIEADLLIRKKLNSKYGFECFKAELYCVDSSLLEE